MRKSIDARNFETNKNFCQRESKNFTLSASAGFTLVELLIVIVIIGILAGVVISIINPIQQQRRAKDGVTKAQIEKMAISAKSLYVSSPRISDRSPTLQEFGLSFASSTDIASNCTDPFANVTASCLFSIVSQPLSSDCSSDGYSGQVLGGTQCNFIFWRDPDEFIIAARSVANPIAMFVYYFHEDLVNGNVNEGFYACSVNYTVSAGGPSGCTIL